MFLWEFWSYDKNILRNLDNGDNLLKNEQQLQRLSRNKENI
jgi:hypothetical protein